VSEWRAVHTEEFSMPPSFPRKGFSTPEVELCREDGGQALIVTPDNGKERGMFLRLQSWEDSPAHEQPGAHAEMMSLLGKRVRLTVEVLDD
jgi:hypothetical protein